MLLAARFLLPGHVDVADAGPHFVLPSRSGLAFGLLAFLVLMSEGAALDWSAAWLRTELGADPTRAALAFAAFSGCMAAGRFTGDALRRRCGAVTLVRGSALLAAIGLAFAVAAGDSECRHSWIRLRRPRSRQHRAGTVRRRRPAARHSRRALASLRPPASAISAFSPARR